MSITCPPPGALATAKLQWTYACNQLCPQAFARDEDNEDVIKLLLLYIARDERFETVNPGFSLHKGLLLHGPVGTGKTLLMQVLQNVFYNTKSELKFKRYNMRELCSQYQTTGQLTRENRHWFVDEAGLTEREIVTSYGNRLNVGDELIGLRYDQFMHGHLTHLTTNLTLQQMQQFYTDRTVSRLHQMMNFIPLSGPDRRLTALPHLPPPVQQPPVNKAEIERQWWQTILRQHSAYKSGKGVDILMPLRQFKMFEQYGLINLTPAQKWQYMEAAKQAIAERPLTQTNLKQRKQAISLRNAIINNHLLPEHQHAVKREATTRAILDFYNSISTEQLEGLVGELGGMMNGEC